MRRLAAGFVLVLCCCANSAADDYVAKVLYDAAVTDFGAGRAHEALKLAMKAVGEKRAFPQARFLIAQCYEKLGKQAEALEAYHVCSDEIGKLVERSDEIAEIEKRAVDRIADIDEDKRLLDSVKQEGAGRLLEIAARFAGKGNHRACAEACQLVLLWYPGHEDAERLLGSACVEFPFDARFMEQYARSNLAREAKAKIVKGGSFSMGGPLFSAFDGKEETWWTCDSQGAGSGVLFEWSETVRIRTVVLIEEGEKTTRYRLQCQEGEGWRDLTPVLLHEGDAVPKILPLGDVQTLALRVVQVPDGRQQWGVSFREVIIIGKQIE